MKTKQTRQQAAVESLTAAPDLEGRVFAKACDGYIAVWGHTYSGDEFRGTVQSNGRVGIVILDRGDINRNKGLKVQAGTESSGYYSTAAKFLAAGRIRNQDLREA